MILKLNKPLYGLRRSPLLWQTALTQTPRSLVLNRFRMNPAVLSRVGSSWTFFYYVDGIVIAFRKHQEAEAPSLIKKPQGNLTGSIIDTKVDTWSFGCTLPIHLSCRENPGARRLAAV